MREDTQFKTGVSGNPNGRPKGSPSKFRFDVAQILKNSGCNPFQILADKAMNKDGHTSSRLQMESAAELAQYVAPKLKSLEIGQDPDSPPVLFTINLNKSNVASV